MKRCPALLPGDFTPSWQLEQLATIPSWLNVAGFQASVVWQSLHCAVVGMWFDPLPMAFAPSWHELQVPVTCP